MKSVKQTDILTGSIPKQLLLFFLPIWFGTLFQQLYNTADTLIVGNFVGTNALAAVGATGPFVNLLVGLFVGLCSGAGVVIAQSWGAHDPDAVDRQVHTALVLSIAVGALLTVLGLVTAAPIMRLLGTPDEILPDAALYLRIYFLGMIPQMLYNMGTNILRAIGVPAAAQSAMYNISNMFIQSSMNSFGTSTIAAWGVYGKIDFLFWMTINSLGIAITTFAGQNFGARQYDRVRRGVRVCLAMAACTTLVISFTFYNLAEVLFRLFSQDDAVVAVGVGMMHVLTPVYITYVCIEVLAGALRGCGDVRVPTLITVFFVCGLRMLWLFIAVPIRHEVATVEMSYPITWSLASALFILYYVKGGWMQRCAEKWEKKQAG